MEQLVWLKDTLNFWIWEAGPAVGGVTVPWLVILLLGTGLFITLRLAFVQLRWLLHGARVVTGRYDDPGHPGDLTHFQALSTALSATVGIGNVAGVAAAIHYGGPGALFWMWVTAFLGMALKYAECTLALKYRVMDEDGNASGGPMRYMERALGWNKIALVFAFAVIVCSFGQGNAIQSFTVADSFRAEFGIPTWLTGLACAALVGLTIIGGVRRIGAVTSWLSPFMALFYCAASLALLALNFDKIPGAFAAIFRGAFFPEGAVAGVAGGTFVSTMLWGVKRGLFSNESGQGSAPIAHASARTTIPVREGVVALLEPFIDTIVVCTMTGLAIILTGAYRVVVEGPLALGMGPGAPSTLNGSPLTALAFRTGLAAVGDFGQHVVTLTVFLFAISTAISWSYYGDRCTQYLFGTRAVRWYRWVYVAMHFVGATVSMELVWGFGDVAVGFMAIPNLVALVLLSGEVKRDTVAYAKARLGMDLLPDAEEPLREAA